MSMARKTVIVHVDKMQRGYTYALTVRSGRNFDPEFRPELTPKEMLALGVFCGKYMTDCRDEFPASWFARARLSPSGRNCSLNYFGVDASQPLAVWRSKGWIHPDDPRGWFQWYCRYYMGRRMPEEDARQIKRWKAIRRHIDQVVATNNGLRGALHRAPQWPEPAPPFQRGYRISCDSPAHPSGQAETRAAWRGR
jgi:hypothetical protein